MSDTLFPSLALSVPPDGVTISQADRLRDLLKAAPEAACVSDILEFPPNSVSLSRGIVAALYVPDFDWTVAAMERAGREPRLILRVMIFEQQGREGETYRRLANVNDALLYRIWQWRSGPPTAPRDWHSMRFGQNPTTSFTREPEKYQAAATQIYLKSQRSNT